MPNTDATAYRPPFEPGRFAAVDRPTLVVDRSRAERNIARMATKAAASGVRFRPHQKTHNNVEIGEWFRAAGVRAITVSSVEHAVTFADAGWDDITIAFPLVTRALPIIRDLASRVRLGVLVESTEAAAALDGVAHALDVWIDVDAGYGRSGVRWDDAERLAAVGRAVAATAHRLRGVLTHSGGTYHAPDHSAIRANWAATAARLAAARDAIAATTGVAGLEISVGDTPGCSVMPRFDGVDEVRPGNFVFFDLQQLALGVCGEDDLALAIACPIVGVYPERGEAVIHGGSVQLSRDGAPGPGDGEHYGRLAIVGEDGWRPLPVEAGYVRAISQEHGVLRVAPEVLAQLRVGGLAFIIPAHACLPANLIRDWLII
jgi:D-serine deaminase-like pyridoxal phosphate-dependent protein